MHTFWVKVFISLKKKKLTDPNIYVYNGKEEFGNFQDFEIFEQMIKLWTKYMSKKIMTLSWIYIKLSAVKSINRDLRHPKFSFLNYSHPILGMGGVLWVRAIFWVWSPPSRQHAKYTYYLLNPIICTWELVNTQYRRIFYVNRLYRLIDLTALIYMHIYIYIYIQSWVVTDYM